MCRMESFKNGSTIMYKLKCLINKLCLNDSGAVGVHEWCEIRLIRPQERLALREESGRIWHSWWAFWLLFAHTKSDKEIVNSHH